MKTHKKKRRKVTGTPKASAPKVNWRDTAEVSECSDCGETDYILSTLWDWDGDDPDRPLCENCAGAWWHRLFRAKRVVREARDRLKSKINAEQLVTLGESCAEDERLLAKWETKLGLKEEE